MENTGAPRPGTSDEDLKPHSEGVPAEPPRMPPPTLPPSAPPPGFSPSPRPPRSGRGWMLFAFLLLILLFFSAMMNLGSLMVGLFSGGSASTVQGGPQLQEVVIAESSSRKKIALIDVAGMIMGGYLSGGTFTMTEVVKQQLDRAAKDDDVEAVLLRVNSPGGEVLASDDICRAITEFQEKSKKPVVASLGGVAASGAYYIAVASRWIVANELTLTGSIGVIMRGYNYRSLMDKVGVRPQVFKSGKFKDMLRSDKSEDEILPEEEEMVREIIDQAYVRFKEVIEEGRRRAEKRNRGTGQPLPANWTDYTDGRILTGKQAYEHGFVDELGDFDAAVERTKKLVGIGEADLVQYRVPYDLTSLLRLFGEGESTTLKLDWGVDLPRIEAGRMYFLFVPGL